MGVDGVADEGLDAAGGNQGDDAGCEEEAETEFTEGAVVGGVVEEALGGEVGVGLAANYGWAWTCGGGCGGGGGGGDGDEGGPCRVQRHRCRLLVGWWVLVESG